MGYPACLLKGGQKWKRVFNCTAFYVYGILTHGDELSKDTQGEFLTILSGFIVVQQP